MPTLTIDTNVTRSEIPPNFCQELTTLLASLLGKPEKFIVVKVCPDQMLTFAGTSEPAASCTLLCIGKIGVEENKVNTAKLMEKFNNDLKIPMDRMYITFVDLERSNVGWNGKTFAS